MATTHEEARKALTVIPGIGKSLADDLIALGYSRVADLKGEDPEKMYARAEQQAGGHLDRCVLYTFRCAVYFASAAKHEKAKLDWWYWKDGTKGCERHPR